jgi:hypothetical protein
MLLRLAFDTDGLEVAVSSASEGAVTKLGLTIALQTFLTALTWICSSNRTPLAGWLTVTVCNRSMLFRVAGVLGDGSSLRLVPASKKMLSIMRGAIRGLGRLAGG